MANFYEIVKSYFTPYYWYILLIICVVIFGLLAKYAYDKYYLEEQETKVKAFSDVANAEMRDNDLIIYFFYVDWCPHCKTAFPEWVKFENQYNGTEMNGYKINCTAMNCTDETPEILNAINEYKIDAFPTVKMLKNNQKIEFDAKITYSALDKFLNTMSSE